MTTHPPSRPSQAPDHPDRVGRLHVEEQAIEFSDYRWEDWLAVVLFWLLCIAVFYQFFTRYVLEDSAAWTEEISRYLLVAVTFITSSLCVRRNTHIHLEFVFQFVPARLARALSTAVDILRIIFLAGGTYLSVALLPKAAMQRMIMFDITMGWVYGAVALGFALMTLRAVQVAVRHWRQGWSALERPMENFK